MASDRLKALLGKVKSIIAAAGILIGSLLVGSCNYPTGGGELPQGGGSSLEMTLAAMDRASAPATLTQVPTAASGAQDPYIGLHTATPPPAGSSGFPIATIAPYQRTFEYRGLSGDTLPGIAARFEVEPHEIISEHSLPQNGYIDPGSLLLIPNVLTDFAYPDAYFPDSEAIYGPSAEDIRLDELVAEAGGYLSGYREVVDDMDLTGVEIVQRVAVERSVNPRILLAFLEFRSGWVFGQPETPEDIRHPIGFFAPGYSGLYDELTLAANHLNIGYYNWRVGSQNRLRFKDGETIRLSPALNAGSVGVYNLLAKFYERNEWEAAVYGEKSLLSVYMAMFGDPWLIAAPTEPLLNQSVEQPVLELPFLGGQRWSFTGGPHRVLTLGSPLGALDFSPVTGQAGCAVSTAWATAPAAGLVTRSENGSLALDLDGDGNEGTGWVLYFLHLADQERVEAGVRVEKDQPIGHPSCEGGNATGSHVHLARKYNGEWLAADGPVSFVLGGWVAHAGERIYEGYLSSNGREVHANPGGPQTSIIER